MADVCCRVRPGGNAVGVPYRLGSKVEIGGSGSLDRAGPLRPPRPLPVWRVIFFLRRIFRLTRVTRIFQKSIFTRTAPRRPGGRPRRAFCCADADAPARGVFFCCKTRRETMTFHKGESGNPAGRQRGSRNRTTILMQSLLEADGEALARKAIDLAKGGDLAGFACAWTGWCRRASTSRSPSTCRGSTRRPTPSPPRRPSWPRSRPASSRRRRPPTSPRWSTSTCGRWRRRLSRSASSSSNAAERPPACRPMPTHDANVEGRSRPMPQPPMPPPSLNRLNKLEKTHARERRVFFIWKDPGDTPADVAAKRDRLIGEGTAQADDKFIYVRWRRPDEK